MGLPQLNSCCFVFDLKTGNIVIGTLNAIFSFILAVTMIVLASVLKPPEIDFTKPRDLNAEAEATGVYVMTIILAIMFTAKFLFDILFVYGVSKEIPGIIRAYFIAWTVFLLLSTFTFFLNAGNFHITTIFMEVINIGFNLYAILLSRSFYVLLNTREEL